MSFHKAVRFYKGEEVPWEVHDCDGSDCLYCRRVKRKFIAAIKQETKSRALKGEKLKGGAL